MLLFVASIIMKNYEIPIWKFARDVPIAANIVLIDEPLIVGIASGTTWLPYELSTLSDT